MRNGHIRRHYGAMRKIRPWCLQCPQGKPAHYDDGSVNKDGILCDCGMKKFVRHRGGEVDVTHRRIVKWMPFCDRTEARCRDYDHLAYPTLKPLFGEELT